MINCIVIFGLKALLETLFYGKPTLNICLFQLILKICIFSILSVFNSLGAIAD